MPDAAERVVAEARALGFVLAGSAPLARLERARFVEAWLAEGRAGEMHYLARRTAERNDPALLVPWARAVVALAYPYAPPPPPPLDWRQSLRGRIAAYAVGTDYHDRVEALLRVLVHRLTQVFPAARFRHYVDTGPVLEREWAMQAGVGWIGKNTLVLDRDRGSYFFLAIVFTDLDVPPSSPSSDHCGGCTRCQPACPTGALGPGYTMDPRRCLAYLTIEHRGAIPVALRPALGNWIFGCDLCQEACPWNRDARDPDSADELNPYLPELLRLDSAGFRARFGRTAVTRAKRRGLLRNVAVALGNSANPAAVPALVDALGDPEPLVRGHAAWALGRLGGRSARDALAAARGRETDEAARAEIEAALADAY
jgi:epoxyqueuosine reductase